MLSRQRWLALRGSRRQVPKEQLVSSMLSPGGPGARRTTRTSWRGGITVVNPMLLDEVRALRAADHG